METVKKEKISFKKRHKTFARSRSLTAVGFVANQFKSLFSPNR